MYPVSPRQPSHDFIDSTADCFIPWACHHFMDTELPMLTRRLYGNAPDFLDDRRDERENKMFVNKPEKLDVKLPLQNICSKDVPLKTNCEGKEDNSFPSYTSKDCKKTYPIGGAGKTKLSDGILKMEASILRTNPNSSAQTKDNAGTR